MEQLSTQSRWQPWKGVILQAVCVLLLFFVGGTMQYLWGMVGLALTELMFLLVAVIYVVAQKTPLKEVFPIKMPSVRDVFGTLVLWIGSLLLGMTSIGLMMWLLPSQAATTVTGMNGIMTSTPPVITYLIVAVMPCICEEAIERGAVMSHFRSLKKPWLIVVIIGLFFGIIHLDVIRFLNTAILGGTLAYLMVKKNNFVLPMILHFVNNSFSVIVSLLSSSAAGEEEMSEAVSQAAESMSSGSPMYFGSFLVLGFAAPLLLVFGVWLINGKKTYKSREEFEAARKKNTRNIVTAIIISFLMLVTGFTILFNDPTYKEMLNEQTAQYAERLDSIPG